MKAVAVFPGRREVALIDVAEPGKPAPGRVKLRMLEVGVCGTDRDIVQFEYGAPPPGQDYFVLGHESLAEVVETGAGVTAVEPGDLVVSMVRHPCPSPSCEACRASRQDFCYTGEYVERGITGLDGFMRAFVEDDPRYLHKLPPDLRDVGVLVEPLTIAEKSLLQVLRIQQRLPWGPPACHRALVLGAGPVGLLGAMLLVEAGFETWIYSRSPAPNPKADIAEAIGARYVSSEETSLDALAARAGEFDLVYEATGAAQLAFDVLEYLGHNGVFVLTGVPPSGKPVSLDTSKIMFNLVLKNQIFMGTVNAGPDAFEAAVRDLGSFRRRWPRQVAALITGRYPIEHYREPILSKAGIKNVIALDGR